MDARTTILIATLAANVVLAAVLAQRHSPSTSTAFESPVSPTSTSQINNADQQSPSAAPDALSVSRAAITGFEWTQLESSDYKEYIANLRAFGVSEKVIRDIIMADVAKLYRPKLAALRPPKKTATTNFWERQNAWYGQYQGMTSEQRAQMKALQKEQRELIKELLGENVYSEMQNDSGHPDWTERMFGSIPKESREQVSEMFQRFQEQQTDIHAKAEGYIDEDTQAELKALRKKFREELSAVLTPEQVKDYELRTSDTANQMRHELSSFEPDETEFRAIFAYKQSMEDFQQLRSAEYESGHPSPDQVKAYGKMQQTVDEQLAAALGPDRLKEYKLMDDWTYRNLLEAGVPKESIFKIGDIKTEVEDAANKIRQDKNLTAEQRTDALKAMRAEAEKTLATLVGERRAKSYANQGGWWLRNISPSR